MEEQEILFEMKTLTKAIGRTIMHENNFNNKNLGRRLTPAQIQIIQYIVTHKKEGIYQKDLEEIVESRRATVSRSITNYGEEWTN